MISLFSCSFIYLFLKKPLEHVGLFSRDRSQDYSHDVMWFFLFIYFFIYMRSFRAQPDKQMLHVSHMLFQNLQSDQVYVIFPQEQSQEESCVKEIWAGDFINDHQEGA